MHGHSANFLEQISGFLGVYYLLVGVMNAVAALYLWQRKNLPGQAIAWLIVAMVFVILSPLALSGDPKWVPVMPQAVRDASMILSGKTGAIVYSVGTTLALVVMFVFRRFFVMTSDE